MTGLMLKQPETLLPLDMNWNCVRSDCWLHKCQPRFSVFAECLPGLRSMTDVDGMTERNGYYFLIEFKHEPGAVPTGQRLSLERLPPEFFVLVAVCPDCRTMKIPQVAIRPWGSRKLAEFKPGSLEYVQHLMKRWAAWADRQRPAWEVR